MTQFITSDLHFGHSNIIKYNPKFRSKFASVEEMDAGLIKEWNALVTPNDTMFFLGDFAFYKKDEQKENIINQLNGRIVWVMGNHDAHGVKKLLRSKFSDKVQYCDYLEENVGGVKVVMSHFPMLSWNKMHYGSVHLHGHCHGSINHLNENTRRTDVGWDSLGSMVTLADAVTMTAAKPVTLVEGDHHAKSGNGSI